MGTLLLYKVDKESNFFFFDRIKGEYSLINIHLFILYSKWYNNVYI